MRLRQSIFAIILFAISVIPGVAATLTLQASATPDGPLYDYSYQFSIAGAGAAVDNIFLGSDDLSPLNVILKVNGNATSDWSWLGNDIPRNYLQFFDIAGTSLSDGDRLQVTFSSSLAPSPKNFALGVESLSGNATNQLNTVLAPTAAPEPGTLVSALTGLVLLAVRRRCISSARSAGHFTRPGRNGLQV